MGIPNVQERLIQQAILQILTPIFDPEFSESSFGFRPKRSAQGAIQQVQQHIRAGYRHGVDMDLSKFFDRVQQDVLLARVARKVHDKRLLGVMGRYLRAGIMVDTQFQPGFVWMGYGGQIRVSPKKIQKFKDRVREITRRNRGVSMRHRYQELRRYFQGWVGYFRLVPTKSFFSELDKWIRRRLRSCYWKQWRHPRTRIAKLSKLGIGKREAVTHGISGKGPWVMSSSQAVQAALSMTYLAQEGLASLLEIWIKFASKQRVA